MSSDEKYVAYVAETKGSVASRKLAAADLRRARKSARDPRSRLLSDSSVEVPKGILKNACIPTKRSVSECVDDLSQIMVDLNLNIHGLSDAAMKLCTHQYLNKEENKADNDCDSEHEKCDCGIIYTGRGNNERPKKSVRFDDNVYENLFVESALYDRRYFAKYHFSSRHHLPSNHKSNKPKKGRNGSSKSDGNEETSSSSSILKSDNLSGCKLRKSQRDKQSKKDKKRRLAKRDESIDTSSDDQGYCSSLHSFSD